MNDDNDFQPKHSWLGAAEDAALRDAAAMHTRLPRSSQGDWTSIETLIRIAFSRGVNTQKYGPERMLDAHGDWKRE
ncbi:hypothetical protein DEI97_013570 [Curtobacterium sp. MCLR17_032]|uniref:hypothetical protein n=1 Tax=Curtobacterium sp. MCLR17_032 TaxID=2175650 RepID=UPI000DA83386|nr:hypothetical protein [Curtobacterium sp. MCLR17_032]WIE60770.1 hypothetical protein DEI97_013570 [Curtobacterium sp. MCLR17_032]